MIVASLGTGCSTIYHRSRALLPPEPAVAQQLRIDEAREAEREVHHAGKELRDRMLKPLRDPSLDPDFDRLKAAILTLERRLAAAGALLAEASSEMAAEHKRLSSEYFEWREYVDDYSRDGQPDLQRRQLEALLLNGVVP